MTRRTVRLVAPLALMAAISWASSRPMPFGLQHGSDKIVHALAFGVLAGLWIVALAPGRVAWRVALASFAISAAWGVIDEIHQSFVPGRSSEAGDAVADAFGASVAAGGWFLRARRVAGRA